MIRLRSQIAPFIFLLLLFKCSYGDGGQEGARSSSGKTKKIQIVYIKVPLSKVLQSNAAFNDEPNSGDYSSGNNANGGSQEQGYQQGGQMNGVPGEGRNINNQQQQQQQQGGYSSYGDYGRQNGQGGAQGNYGGEINGASFGEQNDNNLGAAYGAAVGNALPQQGINDYDGKQGGDFGGMNGGMGYGQGQGMQAIGGDYASASNGGYGGGAFNDGYNGAFGVQMPEHSMLHKGKGRKGKLQYTKNLGKLIAASSGYGGMQTFTPPIDTAIPMQQQVPFGSLKAFPSLNSFTSGFPTFGGGKGITGGLGSLSGFGGMGSSGSFGGLGGWKNKLSSMLFGGKFGMNTMGLLSGMGLMGGGMGWDRSHLDSDHDVGRK